MALVIRRQSPLKRISKVLFALIIGAVALIGAPLSRAMTVSSPSMSGDDYSHPSLATKSIPQKTPPLGQDSKLLKKQNGTFLVINTDSCKSSSSMHINLDASTMSQLRMAAEYEKVCESGIFSKISFFTAMPTTISEANDYATEVATNLHEFAKYNISPNIFLEPTTSSGLLDMGAYQSGMYDSVIDAYFASIKSAGISDEMMGTWVPFPEGNIPVWTSVDPGRFAASVTKTVTYQKKYFPSSKSSILLDTVTYPSVDNWTGGEAISLAKYVNNIPAGLIDSFGLQGFPWSSPTDEGSANNGTPNEYLDVDLAIEAAKILNVHSIWLNTGTFSTKYANIPSSKVTITPEQRQLLLNGVVAEAKKAQSAGFTVAVHLFAENKSQTAEATDWSYWSEDTPNVNQNINVFKSFVKGLQDSGIPIWLFDAKE